MNANTDLLEERYWSEKRQNKVNGKMLKAKRLQEGN